MRRYSPEAAKVSVRGDRMAAGAPMVAKPLSLHLLNFLWLVPCLVMLAIHDVLGLSDAALRLETQLDRDSQLFNLTMVAVFYVGAGGYFAQAVMMEQAHRRWLLPKIAVFAVYWWAVINLFGSSH
jgi:hypothetical protein